MQFYSVKPGLIVIKPLKDMYSEGDVIRCSAVGTSPLKYQWDIVDSKAKQEFPGPNLTVARPGIGGYATFRCSVTNMYGTEEIYFNSSVAGKFQTTAIRVVFFREFP